MVAEQDETPGFGRNIAMDVARATEAAAIAAARFVGRGDERAADLAASLAMRESFLTTAMRGIIAVGADPNPDDGLFHLGEQVGTGDGLRVDIAMTPLEGATICAVGAPNATACLAFTPENGLLKVPPIYMEKIAVGPRIPADTVSLDRSPVDNVGAIAEARKLPVSALTVCVLDRPRNTELIESLRETGCRLTLILDGDVSGAIAVGLPDTGVDAYMGSGGAAEGVLAAAGLRCLGGSLQGRLMIRNQDERRKALDLGFSEPDRVLTLADMVPGEAVFAATGVTDGTLLRGVRFTPDGARSQTMVLRSRSGSRRYIDSYHSLRSLSPGD